MRSNGADEYINSVSTHVFRISIRKVYKFSSYSAEDSMWPQQNGVAGCKNDSLQEMETCMLLDANLENKL